jgi:D-glycero-alpha-D-manno-heptose-7-phosphate kinase
MVCGALSASLYYLHMLITAIAPIRVADVGGWTDTWFAQWGAVCNLAVYPYVEVQVSVLPRVADQPRVRVHAENFGLRFAIDDLDRAYDKMPLLECALRRLGVPDGVRLDLTIHCEVPPGASTGTSAAVSVAIIAALDRLTPGRLTPYQIARLAHRIEAEDLGLQSGIQDQLCSAYGGINLIEMSAFPHASVSPVPVGTTAWWELERRLALVYVGKPHQSSAVHQEVIRHLGDRPADDPRLERLRGLAYRAKDAIAQGDWPTLGAAWDANTQAQRDLHPALVSGDFERVITLARAHGARGSKVNGAGGDGGSVTVLCGDRSEDKRAFLRAVAEAGYTPIPLLLARQGLRVWSSGEP